MNHFTSASLPLTFIESEERYSTYRDRDGEEVYLAHGTGRLLVLAEVLDIQEAWREFLMEHTRWDMSLFLEELRSRVVDPEVIDAEVQFCRDCNDVDWAEDQYSTDLGSVCEACYEDYWSCSDCDGAFRSTTTTLSDTEVCSSCRDENWSFCDHCDGYYRDGNEDEHQHGGQGCTCESPIQARSFTIRNDGEAPLPNDTPTTITLPAGVITDEGLGQIANYLRQYARSLNTDLDDPSDYGSSDHQRMWNISLRLEELGATWQTKQGNFTKRLSRFAYKEHGLKIASEVISQVGCIARDHSTAVDFEIETTRDLNLGPEEFAHEESCWWQSYSESRCALKSNGGFGLRTFKSEERYGQAWRQVTGRAWVMPLKLSHGGPSLTPTFETQSPDAFIVFNGYGALSGYAAARIIAHMAGMTYRKVAFTCSPMYVNNDSGYLVAPEEIAEPYTDGELDLDVEIHANLFTRETNRKVLTNA